VDVRAAIPADHDELFAAFSRVVDDGDGFPQAPPLTRADFDDYWLRSTTVVIVARDERGLAGAYYLKPNFVGRAAHIANAGYFVVRERRGEGLGRFLVEHSLEEARGHGFDALQFNLVFESNPARALYEELGFEAIGRIPDAVDGEAAVIYHRRL